MPSTNAVLPSAKIISAESAIAGGVTLTIPHGGVGTKIRVHQIQAQRLATVAITGTAKLTYTTTNLPNNPSFIAGNAASAGVSVNDIWVDSSASPIEATTSATDVTIVAPAPGANAVVRLTAVYSYI